MADPAATLRALAGACEECDRIERNVPDYDPDYDDAILDQRDILGGALPGDNWCEAAATLRTMADTIDRLTRERDEARVLLTECAAEVEARGVDPSLVAAIRAWLGVCDG